MNVDHRFFLFFFCEGFDIICLIKWEMPARKDVSSIISKIVGTQSFFFNH